MFQPREVEYKQFMLGVLNDMYEWQLTIVCLHDALKYVNTVEIDNLDEAIFSKDELMPLAKDRLLKMIGLVSEGSATNWDVYKALRACVNDYLIDEPGEIINSEAVEIVKNEIRENPDFYLHDILGHKIYEPSRNTINFYFKDGFPFLDLFETYDLFLAFIDDLMLKHKCDVLNCLHEYAICCKAKNTWKPCFEVHGDTFNIKDGDYNMYYVLLKSENV